MAASRWRAGVAGLVLVAMAAVAAPAAGATDDVIAYTRHGDIFVMSDDGAGKTRLTGGAAWDTSPAWSPDGTKIAFIRCCSSVWRPGASALMVMNADGTGLREVSRDLRGKVHEASWSPDGRFLAYSDVIQTPEGDYRASIRITRVTGSGFTRLTGYRSSNVGALWSPDGSSILFHSDRSGDRDLYLVAADGSWRRRLTRTQGAEHSAAWSPDGSRVAFVRESSEYDWSSHVHVLDVEAGGEQRLTHGNVLDGAPAWHPTGASLAFQRMAFDPEFDMALWVVDSAGGEPVRLLQSDGGHAWSPAGDQLLFVRLDDVWVAAADGSDERRLTDGTLYEASAAWRPSPAAAGASVWAGVER